MAPPWQRRLQQRRLPLQQKGNHGVSDGPPKTLSSRFQALSHLQPAEPPHRRKSAPGRGCRRPRPPRRQNDRFIPARQAEHAVQNRSIGTLAGRAQARYRLASVQCTKSAPDRDLFETFHRPPGPLRPPTPPPPRTFCLCHFSGESGGTLGCFIRRPAMCTAKGPHDMV